MEKVTKDKLWEILFIEHIDELPMKIKKYDSDFIFEFDSLDELRIFDESYIEDTHSSILKKISNELGIKEKDIKNIKSLKNENNEAVGFTFLSNKKYRYIYETGKLEEMK